ncbi:type II-A CRISPR-associated protein Csn2, partial [Ellagibacter isourolithinifaciens]|uniref:type II-A CRISPR-associated protein Csn2 n=1 Tax=Ellagibacter isourolithinifaciens TaxID=2137581 RepID=UPI003F8B7F07
VEKERHPSSTGAEVCQLEMERCTNNAWKGVSPRPHYAAMDSSLSEKLLGLGFGMNSDYGFGLEWDLKRYLKFRGFGVGRRADESLLDNLLNFISLALDAGCKKAIVFVNVKTFLTNNEVKALFDHVFYSKMKVLLLENKRDGNVYDYERKMIVDLHFLEH